ncbi:MAG: hypothetical protein JNK82_42830 [Myxococcaceae bacterium]|nr:hypothetical protein [Myxococcaceae bacterium]
MPPPRVQSNPRPIAVPGPRDLPDRAPSPSPGLAEGVAPARDGFDVSRATKLELTKDRQFSPQDIAAIKRRDPALGQAIENAQKSFKSLLDKGAKISVTASAGNGGKPVLTFVPPALVNNPGLPHDLQVHYHGMHGLASAPNGESPLRERIADSFNQTPPTVFVLPEWNGTNDWSNVKNTGTTADDAVKGLGLTGKRGQLTVSAHSLGRNAVFSAIKNGGLKADRLDMQDAFYKGQSDGPRTVAQWLKDRAGDTPPPQLRILVTTNGRMSDKKSIQDEARQHGLTLPDAVFVDQSGQRFSRDAHWEADLKRW